MTVKRCQRCYKQDGVQEKMFALMLQPNVMLKIKAYLCKGCSYELSKTLDFFNFIVENQINVEVIGEIQTKFATTESFGQGTEASLGDSTAGGDTSNEVSKLHRGSQKGKGDTKGQA